VTPPAPETAPAPGTGLRADLGDAQMTWHADGPHTVVTLDGLLAVYETPPLRERLWDLVDQGNGDLVLDLRGVVFIDSTCLGALVGTVKRLRPQPGRTVRIVPGDHVRKVLHITGMSKVFPLHETPDDALAAATSAAADGPPPPADVVLLGQREFTVTGPYVSLHLRLPEGAAAVNAVRDRGCRLGPVLICHDHNRVQVLLAPGAADALRSLPAVVAVTENTTDCGPHRRPPTWAVPRYDQAIHTDADVLRAALTSPAPTPGPTPP